ncbi:hypothetical protein FTO60_02810 [Octadecabacter sp. SW4]|uniref:hypothetical protein n=1 Tax=Octadecabacter sp. SW4 TaxID=2602067 RepID=UPI0011C1DE67|nr:hypothetical protein [Octadecabacter sp. SW4]QEE34735.1 hypothetical protein FTO60_02810 [Octadecabacter sp. SW4]
MKLSQQRKITYSVGFGALAVGVTCLSIHRSLSVDDATLYSILAVLSLFVALNLIVGAGVFREAHRWFFADALGNKSIARRMINNPVTGGFWRWWLRVDDVGNLLHD